METHWIAITRVEDAFRQVESALAWPDEALNNFLVGIPMSMGRLPVLFFPPLQVQAVLKEIKVVLPPCLSLSPSIQNGDTWKVYTEAKLATSHRQHHARCSVRAPSSISPVASDSQAFMELTVSDSSRCVTSTTSMCPISRAVNRKHLEPSCAMALFLKDEEAFDVFEVPISCSAHTDDWIFQASFRKGIKHLLRNSTLPSVNQLENLVQLLPEPAEEETPSSLEKKGATANKPLLSRRAKFQGRISLMGEHLRLIEEEEKARVAWRLTVPSGSVIPMN
ncbi:hypothetical protein OUZ56_024383 [Daphnia magna]|uniref:Uncharacterized protein n=1 Tax=Daphnia magna TaxID=35525 RepID=A0ABR0B0P6_9CRUS|nr:hypothetical protein OUZ56_024383 [Daphnia magna]